MRESLRVEGNAQREENDGSRLRKVRAGKPAKVRAFSPAVPLGRHGAFFGGKKFVDGYGGVSLFSFIGHRTSF